MLLRMTTVHSATSDVFDVHCRQPQQPQEIPEIRKKTRKQTAAEINLSHITVQSVIFAVVTPSAIFLQYDHMSITIQNMDIGLDIILRII